MSYDFQLLNSYLLSMTLTLLQSWLPGGKVIGHEYVVKNPLRNDKNAGSFRINLNTGKWADFATDDKGGDLVSLYAYLNSIGDGEAYRRLAANNGLYASYSANYSQTKPVKIIPKRIPEPEVLYREVWFKESDFGRCDPARFYKVNLNNDDEKFLPVGISEVHCGRACIDESALNQIENNGWKVSGLNVPHWYKTIPIDIDGTNPIETLFKVLNRLKNIRATQVKVFFSGCKGFHITFFHSSIGKINGRIDTSDCLRSILAGFFNDLPDIDLMNYKVNGLIRFVNSINSKSGLYKIPLLEEHLNSELTIEKCRIWATEQRFTTLAAAIY